MCIASLQVFVMKEKPSNIISLIAISFAFGMANFVIFFKYDVLLAFLMMPIGASIGALAFSIFIFILDVAIERHRSRRISQEVAARRRNKSRTANQTRAPDI